MVWVNTETKVFHREGSRYYGKTKQGKYMTEDEAVKAVIVHRPKVSRTRCVAGIEDHGHAFSCRVQSPSAVASLSGKLVKMIS